MIGRMKSVALGMLAAFALGAVAVQTLHAQAKPPVYFVAENNVTNADGYKSEFLSLAQPSIIDLRLRARSFPLGADACRCYAHA